MNNTSKNNKNKAIQNPRDTIWGKILIWTLICMMVVIPFVALLFALFN